MELKIPEVALVVLVGVSGSGKSSFARKHFKRTEIVSSDECRALVSDDENDQAATNDAFDLLKHLVGIRLRRGLLTVIDATNVQESSRKGLIALAREYHCLPVAIVLDVPEKICAERNATRPDRTFGAHVLRQQCHQLHKSMRGLGREGFRHVHVLRSVEEAESVTAIVRERLYNNRKDERGPFDIIGDVHGCFDELLALLAKLGYSVDLNGDRYSVIPPEGRKAVFVGDLVDRGPKSPDVLRLVMSMVKSGTALCVPGNHDMKLHKKLQGKNVSVNHGLAETMEQLKHEPQEFIAEVERFLYALVSHYVLDDGKLVVAHAGLKEEMHGRGSGAVRAFCMYGETTGETDEFGLPVRYEWAREYRGKAKVVYGHTPVIEPQWLNRTIDIDTGCVFGGKLTALRYPEEELVSVEAKEVYCVPVRPVGYSVDQSRALQHEHDDVLDIADVTGKRIVQTRLRHNITIREENSIAALEVMSRFAIDPKWLIHLPPTMSPCETSQLDGRLEHPREALRYYAKRGVKQVICEEKHMGSRAILIVCKDVATAERRFGTSDGRSGVCYTRTGRAFFNDEALATAFIERVAGALTASDSWARFNTDWFCLDCELMPWSAKAQALLKDQYGAVGSASANALSSAATALEAARSRGIPDLGELIDRYGTRRVAADRFIRAYEQYCWTVNSLDDYKLAPFHILATEGSVHVDKDHLWHMRSIRSVCDADPGLFLATEHLLVYTEDEESMQRAIDWWETKTASGGEGMVVKPLDFLAYDKNELLQPAVKCRGSEYLRIIYGPDYDHPENLSRLRERGLSAKRSLAVREFALGIESLERFVRKEPLRLVHESVFGVLALESEEVDPRL